MQEFLQITADRVLQMSALILSVVNGLLLLRVHLRDRPLLRVEPVEPDTYQWWFRIGPGRQPRSTLYGLLAYLDIVNKGYRAVSFRTWTLEVTAGHRRVTLTPISIPEPSFEFGGSKKVFHVLGLTGPQYDAQMRVEPGDVVAGMALYICEVGEDVDWPARADKGRVSGTVEVRDATGGQAKSPVVFRERPAAEIRKMIPDLDALIEKGVLNGRLTMQ